MPPFAIVFLKSRLQISPSIAYRALRELRDGYNGVLNLKFNPITEQIQSSNYPGGPKRSQTTEFKSQSNYRANSKHELPSWSDTGANLEMSGLFSQNYSGSMG